LQYDDTYPDVPILKASERAGCDFCGLLRSAIQSRGFRSVLEDNQLNRYPTLRISFSVQYNFKHCALDGKDDEKVGVWILAVVLRLFPEDRTALVSQDVVSGLIADKKDRRVGNAKLYLFSCLRG
jgi:hypothetical protein